jgi:AraC family ethanolamine operon transcriptional activator
MPSMSVPNSIPSLAPCFSCFDSTDSAAHAERFDGWSLHMDQMSPGRFTGRLVTIQLGGLQIVRETTTQALLKQGSAWPDALVFSFPLAASSGSHLNGRPLTFPSALLTDGAHLPPLLTAKHLDVMVVAVARSRLAALLEAFGEARVSDFIAGYRHQSHFFGGFSSGALAMTRGLRQICEQGRQARTAIGFERARLTIEEAVIDGLAEILSANVWDGVDGVTPQKKVVDRIREYVFARIDDPPSVADLCQQVGVSRRTLQSCFQASLGMTPLQYLRTLRLNAARRDLCAHAAAGSEFSIGDVAAQWGFWHWSRFTIYYRQHFGELPSCTVRRVSSASH